MDNGGHPMPDVPRAGLWTKIWERFWTLPLAIVLISLALGLTLPELDQVIAEHLPRVFQGGPDGARSVLGTIASAMISVTGLVFSITMVVLQLASSQFTPRILGSFLSSRIVQVTLGVFTATFVFSLTTLRAVIGTSADHDQFVPQVSVSFAFLLVLASVGCFLAFIHHITTSVQVSKVVQRIGTSTLKVVQVVYPDVTADEPGAAAPTGWTPGPGTPRTQVCARRDGYLHQIDYRKLVKRACEMDCTVVVDVTMGTYLVTGQGVATIWGRDDFDDEELDTLAAFFDTADDRALRQDPAYGIRQLVDIAERALSPGVNDPTTATQVIDQLHRICRRLVTRANPSRFIADDEGAVRVVHRPQTVADQIRLAVGEIAHYGESNPPVPQRLGRLLDDLAAAALPRHEQAVNEARSLLP